MTSEQVWFILYLPVSTNLGNTQSQNQYYLGAGRAEVRVRTRSLGIPSLFASLAAVMSSGGGEKPSESMQPRQRIVMKAMCMYVYTLARARPSKFSQQTLVCARGIISPSYSLSRQIICCARHPHSSTWPTPKCLTPRVRARRRVLHKSTAAAPN